MRVRRYLLATAVAWSTVGLATAAAHAEDGRAHDMRTRTGEGEEPGAEEAEPDASPQAKSAAVNIRILVDDGTELQLSNDSVAWQTPTDLVLEHDGAEHRVSMKIEPKSEETLAVSLGYVVDGKPVIESQLEARGGAEAEVRGPDGEVRLSVLVTPKKPRSKLVLPDGVNPLDGLP